MDAIDLSGDLLHLAFINIFWVFFERTILKYIMEYEAEARLPCEAYLNSIGIPVKLVGKEMDDLKGCLTGRDAKVLVAGGVKHISALLHFAHAGKEAVTEEMAAPAATGDDDFTWDGGGAADDDADDDSDDSLDCELRFAKSWDALFGWLHELRPFEANDETYCEQRAVAAFNKAGPMVAEYKYLHPDAQSATCHVALCVVPRQVRLVTRCCHLFTHSLTHSLTHCLCFTRR